MVLRFCDECNPNRFAVFAWRFTRGAPGPMY
jgi:hypothetical protein